MSQPVSLLRQLKPGDWLVLAISLFLVLYLFYLFWFQKDDSEPARLIIWSQKSVFANIVLPVHQEIHVNGPLGETIIEIDGFRARVAKDPGPRQYCVSQGWLSKPGDIDICLPNQISLYMPENVASYDSFHY